MSSVLKGPSSNNGAAAAETTIPAESQGAKPKSKVKISHTGMVLLKLYLHNNNTAVSNIAKLHGLC